MRVIPGGYIFQLGVSVGVCQPVYIQFQGRFQGVCSRGCVPVLGERRRCSSGIPGSGGGGGQDQYYFKKLVKFQMCFSSLSSNQCLALLFFQVLCELTVFLSSANSSFSQVLQVLIKLQDSRQWWWCRWCLLSSQLLFFIFFSSNYIFKVLFLLSFMRFFMVKFYLSVF